MRHTTRPAPHMLRPWERLLTERVEVEERVTREDVVAVGEEPVVDLALLLLCRVEVVPRVGTAA